MRERERVRVRVRRTDGRTDRQTDRQTDTEKKREIYWMEGGGSAEKSFVIVARVILFGSRICFSPWICIGTKIHF